MIEYLNDVNREHAEVLVEQNINGKTDTSYIYGAEINDGYDRISLDRFDGSTGYYLYDARGSVSGITSPTMRIPRAVSEGKVLLCGNGNLPHRRQLPGQPDRAADVQPV